MCTSRGPVTSRCGPRRAFATPSPNTAGRCWNAPPRWRASAGPGALIHTPLVEDVLAAERQVCAGTLTPWREKYPQVDVEQTLVCGHPVGVLCEASAAADLVVVGSRGLGRFGSAVLGSIGHGVLHHARCPVAVVRARGEA